MANNGHFMMMKNISANIFKNSNIKISENFEIFCYNDYSSISYFHDNSEK